MPRRQTIHEPSEPNLQNIPELWVPVPLEVCMKTYSWLSRNRLLSHLRRTLCPLAIVGALLTLLSGLATTSAQAPPRKLPVTEELEKYGDPPAYIFRIETSRRMVSQYGPFASYQVNVDAHGNNIVGDAANEPSICLNPTDLSRMAIGWRQFDSVFSNFREGGYGYTTDGGTSWTFLGVLENNVWRSDPVLNSDDTGLFFYLSLYLSPLPNQLYFDDMWRSLDGGQSWTNIAPAEGGDKQWFTIDNTNSRGNGFQYQAWSTGGNYYGHRQFTRSTDGGVTWSPNVAVSNSFNPFLGYPNQNKMGDYITIVSDNTGGNVAYCATFNLEEDIYYVRVAPETP
jgi:hypothetical protein